MPTSTPRRVLYFTPDDDTPAGGIKVIYRHVDVLRGGGVDAAVLHTRSGFRCTWFDNRTNVVSTETVSLTDADVLVIPEIYGPRLAEIARGVPKVVFNQGAYNTFASYPIDGSDSPSPYEDAEVLATLVVSEDSQRYLRFAFPTHRVVRVRLSIDPRRFAFDPRRKRAELAFMPRRNQQDILQVINLLRVRGSLDGFRVRLLDGLREREVAEALGEAAVFLAFGHLEGFGLPAAEAMASGCAVVGYHGNGGREFFDPDYSWPVDSGDVLGFVRAVEEVIQGWRSSPERILEAGARASAAIRERYSPEHERDDLIQFWSQLLDGGPGPRAPGRRSGGQR